MAKTTTLMLALWLLSGLWLPASAAAARSVAPAPLAVSTALRFEANAGQFDDEVRFVARSGGSALYVTSTGAVAVLCDGTPQRPSSPLRRGLAPVDAPAPRASAVRMTLDGADAPRVAGVGERAGRTNYFLGRDALSWRTGVASYSGVRCFGAYEGIDLVYSGASGAVEYDFVVAPGADPSRVRMHFSDAGEVSVDGSGALVVRTATGDLRQRAPIVYQETSEGRRMVAGRFALRSEDVVGFDVGAYDTTAPLVVDPVLEFAALVGGGGRDVASDVAVSGSSVFVAGYTVSADFPTRGGVGPYAAGIEAFVMRLDGASAEPVYSTFVGGAFTDTALALDAMSDGRVVVAGYTSSPDFPRRFPVVDRSSSFDAFVFELAPTGDELVYSTTFGGSGDEFGYGVALDAAGAAYIAGSTVSQDLPVRNAAQPTLAGATDAFVAKIAPGGGAIVYATYLGGEGVDVPVGGVAVDAAAAAYVTGHTDSSTFPVATPVQGYSGAGDDLFVTKLVPSGSSVGYSTYLGGDENDAGLAIAVDGAGRAIVAGTTESPGFPAKLAGARHEGEEDAFVLAMAQDGASVAYALPIRTLVAEVAQGVAVDAAGRAYVVGYCESPDFPIKDPVQRPFGGTQDAFLSVVDPAGTSLVMSTKLGGRIQDAATAVVVTPDGRAIVVGSTASVDFPVAGDTLTSLRADEDVFVVRVAPDDGPTPPSVTKVTAAGSGRGFKVTARGSGFVAGARIYVGDDVAPWEHATVAAKKIKLAGGDALAAKFPRGVAIRIRVANPDGGMAFASLVR